MRLPSVLTPDIWDTIHQAGDFGDNYDDIDGEAGSGSKEDNVTLNSLML